MSVADARRLTSKRSARLRAKEASDRDITMGIGTPHYCAPELLTHKKRAYG